MQIISGIYKNHPLKSPNDAKTHPMGSREKLALFNMLLPYLPSSIVLDAFAGSGSLGAECLSRGASKVVFVEKSPKIARIIRENIASLGADALAKSEIITSDIANFTPNTDFDVIIADPPYPLFDPALIAKLIPYLKSGGVLALSHPKLPTPLEFPELNLLSTHSYAAANLSIYHKVAF